MELRISSPCPLDWNDLVGDDRIRYCGKCRLNVYNLADMPRAEVEALVRSTEGRLCGRLYLRGDRTATAQNCRGYRARQLLRRWLTAAALLLLSGFTWVSRSSEGPPRTNLPGWANNVLDVVDPPKKQSTPIIQDQMGVMICPRKTVPPAPVPTPGPNGG
jgi:hypothetical protein